MMTDVRVLPQSLSHSAARPSEASSTTSSSSTTTSTSVLTVGPRKFALLRGAALVTHWRPAWIVIPGDTCVTENY
eukprot:18460-Rhodomonas_salina.2